MGRRIISASRFLIAIAVFCIFLAATALLLYGAADTYYLITDLISQGTVSSTATKEIIIEVIELVDLFLLSTVLYVVALGLYELFIDDKLAVPAWMAIHNLDDLKNQLIAVVIVVMGVAFLGQVIGGAAPQNLFWQGAGIAVVIAALTFFLSYKVKKDDDRKNIE